MKIRVDHQHNPADDEQKIRLLTGEFGPRAASSLTQQELAAFLEARNTSPATFNRYRATLSMIYREAIRNGWLERNPARLVKAKKENNSRICFLSDDEEESIRLIIAEEYPERFLNEFEIAVHTGMRRSEQFSLAWSQVDMKGKRIHLLKTKNGSGRVIPLNAAALAAFERQSQVSGHAEMVFLADDGKPLIQKPIRRWFEDTMLKAQIRDFSWHCLRHTFASRLVMAGVSLKAVQELMGHKTIQMTARYAHLSPDHLQSAVELISGAKPAKQPLKKPTATRTATSAKKATRKR